MAVTTDDILIKKMGRGKRVTGLPSIDRSLMGAPATMEGSGTSDGKTAMTGTPVQSAVVPPAVTADLKGGAHSGEFVRNSQKTESVGSKKTESPQGVPENVSDESLEATTPAVEPPTVITTTQAPIQSRVDMGQGAADEDLSVKPRGLSYAEMYQRLSPYKPPTEEDLEKERKKQKREAIFAAIGEGISAMSNLYYTTQYAPNAFDPSKGMAAGTKARFDRLKKEREENQRQYMDGFMRAMKMDDDAEYKGVLAQMKEREQKRKEAESNITIALKQADIDYKEAKTDGQAYINELYRLKGQALEAGMGAQVALIEEKIKTEQAKQKKYLQGGSGGGKSGKGKNADNIVYAINEKGEVYDTGERTSNYQESVKRSAKNGVVVEKVTESTSSDRRGEKKSTSSSRVVVKAAKKSSAKSGFSIHK